MKKVFDAHIHHLFEMPIEEAIRIFKLEFPVTGTERQAFMSIPNDVSPQGEFYFDEMQNIRKEVSALLQVAKDEDLKLIYRIVLAIFNK